MALGQNIKFLRKAKGWPMGKLATAVGTSAQTINKLEKTDAKRSEYATAIAKEFGLLNVSWLLRFDIQTDEQAQELLQLLGEKLRLEDLNDPSSPMGKLCTLGLSLLRPVDENDEEESAHFDGIAPEEEFLQTIVNYFTPPARFGINFGSIVGVEVEIPRSDSAAYAEWVKRKGPPTPDTPNVASARIGMRQVPLLNYVQAGAMAEAAPNFPVDEYLLTDLDLSERAFALEIKGKSMVAPPGSGEDSFNEGDRIIVDCDTTPLPGDFVVAKNGPDGEHGEHAATFKKYRPRGVDEQGREVFELVPLNPDYPTMRSDRQPLRIIGVMMEHRKYRKKR